MNTNDKFLKWVSSASLPELENRLLTTEKSLAVVTARLEEGEIVVSADDGNSAQDWKYGSAYAAKRLYQVEKEALQRAIAQRRKEQRIAEHAERNQQGQAGRRKSLNKELRQGRVAFHFVQIVLREANTPLFEKWMREAKEAERKERENARVDLS